MDADLLAFYSQGGEEPRLVAGGPSRLEYARTLELLERHLPPTSADVLDVGGGPGRYASWLADRGHRVTLLDIVPLHLEQAATRAKSGLPFSIAFGDARALGIADESYDAVLLMGPLYHLPDAHDRRRAMKEAARVTRPGGVIICTAITRFAALLDGLESGQLSEPEWRAAVDRTLATGAHFNPTRHPDLFTTAYFHRPEELQDELVAAELIHEQTYGVEGPGTLLWSRWDDDQDRENLLLVARLLETEPSVLGMSPHLLAVGRKAVRA